MSPAGWFKGKKPTVDAETLEKAWVADSAVLYIGKATNLRERLDTYRRHGAGRKAGHWGGRYIWQCTDSDALRVGWKAVTPNPGDAESELIAQFRIEHDGRLPFANLNSGRRRR